MDDRAAFLDAVTKDDDARVQELLEASPSLAATRNDAGISAPLLALYHHKRDRAETLAAQKERIEPLDVFEASAFGRTERLKAILAEEPGLVNTHARDGFFPLGLAAFFGREDVVAYLLGVGADPNLSADNPMKVRAIHAACAAGNPAIVRAVIEAGADVNAVQQAGFTPLHAAAMSGHLELAELLLEQGADPSAKADDGRTALEIAREAKHQAVVELLGGAG